MSPGCSLLYSCHKDGWWLFLPFWNIDSLGSSEMSGLGLPRNPLLALHHTQINPSAHAHCHWGVSSLLLACFKIHFLNPMLLKSPNSTGFRHLHHTTDALDTLRMTDHAFERMFLSRNSQKCNSFTLLQVHPKYTPNFLQRFLVWWVCFALATNGCSSCSAGSWQFQISS